MSRKRAKRTLRPKVLPLGIKNASHLERPVWIALEALGTDWLHIDHVEDIFAHGTIVAKLADTPELKRAGLQLMTICVAINERKKRTGKVGVTGTELSLLKDILPQTIPWVQEQPNIKIHKALTC